MNRGERAADQYPVNPVRFVTVKDGRPWEEREMSRMRGLGLAAVLGLAALAGCSSANKAPAPPVNTREPPIAGRQQQPANAGGGNLVQTSAFQSATECQH
jgi:hypothetical protein